MRHRAVDGSGCIVTNDRNPPPGYAIEFDLGLVHVHAQPGTVRLVSSKEGFFSTPFEGQLDSGLSALGFVEQAPLPMLEALELRRDPASGQTVLVAGRADPLYALAEPLGAIGFIESYPINPREAADLRVRRLPLMLQRTIDHAAWRHRYAADERLLDDAVALGGIWGRPRHDSEALRLRDDGVVTSALLDASVPSRPALQDAARWVAAPLAWAGRRPRAWAVRATASRARQLARTARPHDRARGGERVIGYLLRERAPDWSPLFSARHSVLGDQYLTRSELEARDMGYVVEGIVGYVADALADTTARAASAEVKWASRFGQRRRYVEGRFPV